MRAGTLALFFPAVVRSELVLRQDSNLQIASTQHLAEAGAVINHEPTEQCQGYNTQGNPRKKGWCGQDETHWVCAQLLGDDRNPIKFPTSQGEDKDFWQITGQKNWQEMFSPGGTSWCICHHKYEQLLTALGGDCSKVTVNGAASKLGKDMKDEKYAYKCLQEAIDPLMSN